MKIETKRCVFCSSADAWVLEPFMIEVNSRTEFKAAWFAFTAELRRFHELTQDAGGGDDQE